MTVVTAASSSASPTARQVWTRTRGPLLAVLVLVAAGIALAATHSGDRHGRLDPRSADRYGSRAVAELLKDRGVSVRVVTTLKDATSAAGPDTTLLVTAPDLLTPDQQHTLRTATTDSAGRTVLLAAGPPSVRALAPGVRVESAAPVATRAPRCSLEAARLAGAAETGGLRYSSDSLDALACYPADGLPSLLLLRHPAAGDTVLLGSPDILYNDRLDKQGNASLALQLLGSHSHLIWYLPRWMTPPPQAADTMTAARGTGARAARAASST